MKSSPNALWSLLARWNGADVMKPPEFGEWHGLSPLLMGDASITVSAPEPPAHTTREGKL
jgi:hypothetical protein